MVACACGLVPAYTVGALAQLALAQLALAQLALAQLAWPPGPRCSPAPPAP